MNHTGKYAVGPPQMYAKENLWYPNITPIYYLHAEMHLGTFRWGVEGLSSWPTIIQYEEHGMSTPEMTLPWRTYTQTD